MPKLDVSKILKPGFRAFMLQKESKDKTAKKLAKVKKAKEVIRERERVDRSFLHSFRFGPFRN